ncbi:dihydrofolate reductase [Fictibacillus enclensis]|uniref:Dihydrofolate reductase n=1 Tax=Fictibacillus enclensis TaxID=1017270 RepID=A0A0V8J8Q9_9BACL|nr:dihydrofolate reductase [Fictibacillus enclensis]KSU83385.1 dihydrofolate reductase [Fictibacillus enclensis]SCC14693.1 dihydrofolate reductase [Fictibacillus enclensis]
MISYVFAMDRNRLIGKQNDLPWHLPADLKHFKKVTMGKPILMGRKTYESIGKPLPGRENIILTRDESFQAEGCTVLHTVQDALDRQDTELCVIGGSEVFRLFMPYVERMYVTRIDESFDGDTYFPAYDESEWNIIDRTTGILDEKNKYPHEFLTFEKNNDPDKE